MAPDRLLAAILAIAFPIFSIWMLARSIGERQQNQETVAPGLVVLRFTRSLRIWWYVCGVLLALGFASDPLLGKIHRDDIFAYLIALLGFTVLLGLGTWFLLRYSVEYDENNITIQWPNGRRRSVPWNAVTRVEYKKGNGVIVSHMNGKPLLIPSILPGAGELVRVAAARVASGA
jgi:hypothetical protein